MPANMTSQQLRATGVKIPFDANYRGPVKAARAKRGTGVHAERKRLALARFRDAARPLKFIVMLPIKVVSESNQRENHFKKHKRTSAQRQAIMVYIQSHKLPNLPAAVKLTRHGRRALDSDNLAGSFKGIRDQIAAIYGCGDSSDDPLTWNYAQTSAAEYGVTIEIISTGAPQ